ncbi:CFEM domain-containing protein [Mycena sanguinolenta]|uniref:CFEM domain-containing protein n=1 Tax=Mycena sanguinolenta TaxID=230812 RepID=A0A8H6Z530_9AGAR|nr:CFEM domain-containing protein [Mycena sanguinolenta]
MPIVNVRDTSLSKCAATCHIAAGKAVCPDLATTCQCGNANFRFDFLSCVQGECQASEVASVDQFFVGICGSGSLNAKPTATTAFLPTNANADINEPPNTSSSSRTIASSGTSGVTVTSSSGTSGTTVSNVGSNETVYRNGAPAGAIVASVLIGVVVVALVVFVFWIRNRRRQRRQERRFPDQFLGSESPVQRIGRSPSIMKVATATDVESQAEMVRSNEMQESTSDEAPPEKGAPARTPNLRLVDIPVDGSEGSTAPPSAVQDAPHTEETMVMRLRRVEAQLAALLTTASESPAESPPSYWG